MFTKAEIRERFERRMGGAADLTWDESKGEYADNHTYSMYLGYEIALKDIGVFIKARVEALLGF